MNPRWWLILSLVLTALFVVVVVNIAADGPPAVNEALGLASALTLTALVIRDSRKPA